MRQGDEVRYLHADHLGSTGVVSNESGNAVERIGYLPFGEVYLSSGLATTDRLFTGQRLESGITLYRMGVRWYDPMLGRWLSPDVIVPGLADSQAFNRYSYVANNPLRYVDPTGYQGLPAWLEQMLDTVYPNGSNPPEEYLSEEEKLIVGQIHDEAVDLSGRVQGGEITDCEALAQIMEFTAEEIRTSRGYPSRYPFWTVDDTDMFLRDLGLVIGGIRYVAVGFESSKGDYGTAGARRTYLYENTYLQNNPLSVYYVGDFHDSGFRPEYRETENTPFNNQVRHFIGGTTGGSAWIPVWPRNELLSRESDPSADRELHKKAFELSNMLFNPGLLSSTGRWVRRNICECDMCAP